MKRESVFSLLLVRFSISIVKPMTLKRHLQAFIFLLQIYSFTKDTEKLANHSKFKADTCCCSKARENAGDNWRLVLIKLLIG